MFSILGDIGSFIMAPLYYVTSFVLSGLPLGLRRGASAPTNGWAWVLSIIGLTLVIRAALIPLFVKQIKSSRNMQLLQPKVKELQKKYGHDRERLAQETMALYKETGTNPFASCLPILLQMPIFLALFRLIDHAAKGTPPRACSPSSRSTRSQSAKIFGAEISATLHQGRRTASNVRILAAVLVIAMTATTFLTQRQLMSKNMPADAMTGQYAQQQKMLLYVLPRGLRGRWHRVPDRRALLLDDLEPVDDGPAVLRDPQQPGPRHAGRQGEGRTATRRSARARARARGPAERRSSHGRRRRRRRAAARQQPKKQTRSQRKKRPAPAARTRRPAGRGPAEPERRRPRRQRPTAT